jgi:hypothetical protein
VLERKSSATLPLQTIQHYQLKRLNATMMTHETPQTSSFNCRLASPTGGKYVTVLIFERKLLWLIDNLAGIARDELDAKEKTSLDPGSLFHN